MKKKIETFEDAHASIEDLKIRYEAKILEIEKDSTISEEKKIEDIEKTKEVINELFNFKNVLVETEKKMMNKMNCFDLVKMALLYALILILVFFTSNNKKIKDIIYFILIFNFSFSTVVYCSLEYVNNLTPILKTININILILVLGFLYNNLIFSYFGIDIIYYLTFKDYLISVYHIILILLYFCVCVFISSFFKVKIEKKIENIIIKNKLIKMLIGTTPFLCYFSIGTIFIVINEFFLLKLLNLSSIYTGWSQILGIIITSLNYFLIAIFFEFFNYKNKNNIDIDKKIILMLFSINLIVNIAFLDLYNFLGSDEKTLKAKLDYTKYENQLIYKIKSTENYDFYISKPENKILVFKRNLKVLEFK